MNTNRIATHEEGKFSNYFGARYYDSEIGRWCSVDPRGDKYPGWSPYCYTMNNPLRFVDTKGMEVVNPYDKETARGKWEYINKTIEILRKTKEGERLYTKLNEAEQKFVIVLADLSGEQSVFQTDPIGAYGLYDPWTDNSINQKFNELLGGTPKLTGGTISLDPIAITAEQENPALVLGHEFKHAALSLNDFGSYSFYSSTRESSNEWKRTSRDYHEIRGALVSERIIEHQLKTAGLNKNIIYKK